MVPNIEELIEKIKSYNPACDEDLVRRAFLLALDAHADQKRDSGDPYITHPYAVAEILVQLQLDDKSIAAAFLHDVVEDTGYSLEYVRNHFGEDVALLVDGVTKLSRLEYHCKMEQQAENLRKMFLYMAKDIRIILIKLADRLHNMRTLSGHHSQLRQQEIAQETVDIFAPLAHRLGISKIKNELEDLSLRYLEPEKYNDLVNAISMEMKEREAYIQEIIATLDARLQQMGIRAELSGRPKSYYSIYNKMKKQKKELSEIFDLNAVRAIVDDVRDCYGVLGVIHTIWKPIPGRFKDYIAMPKDNMYQSIHTTVIGPNGSPFEIQIRTHEMHWLAEYGIAAHWRYKEGTSGDKDFDAKMSWLRQMLDWQKDLRDAGEFMEQVKTDLFDDNVYVFTPKGDVIQLPAGSTPIDFAYRVHTDVGHQCVGAKVNRHITPLDYQLANGDIVEILTAKGSGPSMDWLKILKTSQAKAKVRQWFKREQAEDNQQKGHDLLTVECRKQGCTLAQLQKAEGWEAFLRENRCASLEELCEQIGSGAVLAANVLKRLLPEKTPEPVLRPVQEKKQSEHGSGVIIDGMDGLAVRFARCCNPLRGDDIIGYITRGRGVSVHRQDCPNAAYYRQHEPGRLVAVSWAEEDRGVFQAEIEVQALDRPRILIDVMNTISDTKTPIRAMRTGVNKKGINMINVKIEVKSLGQMEYIMNKLRRLRDVTDVRRVAGRSTRG